MPLLAIDLDGTLLGRDEEVSAANLAALARVRDAGWDVVVATGRSWRESARALDAVGRSGEFVGAGGAQVSCAATGAPRHCFTLDAEVAAEVAHVVASHGHLAHLLKDHHASTHDYCLVGDGAMHPAMEWWLREHGLERIHLPCLREPAHRPFADATIRVGTVAAASDLEGAAKEIERRFRDRVRFQHWSAQTPTEKTHSRTHLLEVFAPGVDKWSAIQWICARRGVDPADVVAIGDGLNDVEMVRGAGLGIAMASGDPRVHAVADAVVGHHAHDGAAEAIDWALRARGRRGAAVQSTL